MNTLEEFRCSDEENRYRVELIAELIEMQEHPENSNIEYKNTIIAAAREKKYGHEVSHIINLTIPLKKTA